jgi:hypothetical protein
VNELLFRRPKNQKLDRSHASNVLGFMTTILIEHIQKILPLDMT